jgi:hypothetical protein
MNVYIGYLFFLHSVFWIYVASMQTKFCRICSPPHKWMSIRILWYIYICMYVCISWVEPWYYRSELTLVNSFFCDLLSCNESLYFSNVVYWFIYLRSNNQLLPFIQMKIVTFVTQMLSIFWRHNADLFLIGLYTTHSLLLIHVYSLRAGGACWD